MGYIKTDGVIIKETYTGEADKIVTVLSRDKGRISGYARGARRPKSQLIAGVQFLCYSSFTLFKGRDMYHINSCDVIEPFYNIRTDVVKLTYAAHIAEILNDVIQENQPAARVLKLLLNTLHMLANTNKSPELIVRIFEMRILSLLGYSPQVRGCIHCGKEELDNMLFSFRDYGFVCRNCAQNDKFAMQILHGTARAIQHIVYARLQDLFKFDVSNEVLDELEKVNKIYLRQQLDKEYNKLDFLKNLKQPIKG